MLKGDDIGAGSEYVCVFTVNRISVRVPSMGGVRGVSEVAASTVPLNTRVSSNV